MPKSLRGRALVVVAGSMLFATVAAAEPNMTEGNWEIKGEMKMEGLPFQMPPVPVSYSQCLTKKDLVPEQKEKNGDCTTESQKVEGNNVTWVTHCVDKKGSKIDGTGTMTYKGTTFEGTIHNVMTDTKGGKVESRLNMNGKRIGDCK